MVVLTSPKGCQGSAGIFGHCTVDTTTETLVCGHWDDQIVLNLHSCMADADHFCTAVHAVL